MKWKLLWYTSGVSEIICVMFASPGRDQVFLPTIDLLDGPEAVQVFRALSRANQGWDF